MPPLSAVCSKTEWQLLSATFSKISPCSHLCSHLFSLFESLLIKLRGLIVALYFIIEVTACRTKPLLSPPVCSCFLTVCSSPWPATWAKSSRRRHTQRWTSTCQRSQPCLLRNTDEAWKRVTFGVYSSTYNAICVEMMSMRVVVLMYCFLIIKCAWTKFSVFWAEFISSTCF